MSIKNTENATVIKTDKLLKFNQLFMAFAGVAYSISYFASAKLVNALLILLLPIITAVITLFVQKKHSIRWAINILTNSQWVLGALLCLLGGELEANFTLLVAIIALNSIYYRKKIILMQWILSNVSVIAAIFFGTTCYSQLNFTLILKGILGLNLSLALLYFLVSWGASSLINSMNKENEVKEVMLKVENQMEVEKENAKIQQDIFNTVKAHSNNLSYSSEKMLEISQNIANNAEKQTYNVDNLSQKSTEIANDIKDVEEKATISSKLAKENVGKLNKNKKNMETLVDAMKAIENSTQKINNFIKTIEEIASQTNIVALNASVESARAGAAGRGFAIVANEVRTLAAKSSEAAKESTDLVEESIENVQKGAELVKEISKDMVSVLDFSKNTYTTTNHIKHTIINQVEKINSFMQDMSEVSDVIVKNSQTATESSQISIEVSNEIQFINEAITK